MKNSRYVKRLSAILVLLLMVNTVLSVFPPYPEPASICAAEQSSPLPEDGSGDSEWTDKEQARAMASPKASEREDGTEPSIAGGEEDSAEPPATGEEEDSAEPPATGEREDGAEPPAAGEEEDSAEPSATGEREDGAESPAAGGEEDSAEPPATGEREDGAEPPSTDRGEKEEDKTESSSSAVSLATPSEVWAGQEKAEQQPLSLMNAAVPLTATPSEAVKEISSVDVPSLVALGTDEASDNTWKKALPQQASAKTGTGEELWCKLQWNVDDIGHVSWKEPGVYLARLEVVPPEGCELRPQDSSYEVVISIHPPGTSQVIEVFTPMSYRRNGHTWTFAMKAGQDMEPLKEALASITTYIGILDTRQGDVVFSAQWDFSEVNPDEPGIYQIHRSLTLDEGNVPEGVSPEDIYLPEYWKNLPVLFSVEGTDGPELNGVLESPYDFFGSYGKLSEEELDALEVWYSVGGGGWTLQTDEGLMETYETNFSINKEIMEEGRSYSFRLELGDFVSRELTVEKHKGTPIWLTFMLDGSRDGTVEVEFPPVSQPPPVEPTHESPANPPPTDSPGDITDSGGETIRPASGGSGDGSSSGSQGLHAAKDPGGGPGEAAAAGSGPGVPPYTLIVENVGTSQSTADGNSDEKAVQAAAPGKVSHHGETGIQAPRAVSRAAGREHGPEAGLSSGQGTALPQETKEGDSRVGVEPDGVSGPAYLPEEVVTRWTTQISGVRARKLIEMYPDWIRFQKEEVSVLLSSQWLKEQQMGDSDVLNISVSPGDDHTVTILINQKVPKSSPVCRITVGKKRKDRFSGAAATAVLSFSLAGATIVYLKKRR